MVTGEARVPTATFELHPVPPYRLDLTVWALRRRDRNRIDRWDGAYRRALLLDDQVCAVVVRQRGGLWQPTLEVTVRGARADHPGVAGAADRIVRRMLGTDVDLAPFYALADAHPATRALSERFRGVRPPRFPSVFEALVNAVANQQLSLEVGLTLLNRLSAEFGLPAPAEPSSGAAALRAFPAPQAILAAPEERLRGLGFSRAKTDYLRGISAAADDVDLDLDLDRLGRADRATAVRELTSIRGIGRWSAEYVLLRGLGRVEVFPGDDVGARHRLRGFFDPDHDPGYAEIAERLQPWAPYAGLLYFHLLLLGLAERGQISA